MRANPLTLAFVALTGAFSWASCAILISVVMVQFTPPLVIDSKGAVCKQDLFKVNFSRLNFDISERN